LPPQGRNKTLGRFYNLHFGHDFLKTFSDREENRLVALTINLISVCRGVQKISSFITKWVSSSNKNKIHE